MNIVIFAAFYYPYRGGYVENIYEVSRGFAERGYRVTIIACNTHGAPADENYDGVRVLRIPCWNPAWLNNSFPIPKPWRLFSLFRGLAQQGFSAVITETRFYPTTFLGVIFGLFQKISVLHIEHGSCHPVSSNFFIKYMGVLIDHTFGFFVCRSATAVVGVSAVAAQFAGHLGARNPSVIYNPIDTAFWKSLPLPTFSREIVMVFTGRLIYAKGVQDFLRAIALLRDELSYEDFEKIHIVIIGDGPYKDSLMRLAKALSLSPKVSFTGARDRSFIREELRRGSIFINPSYSEGLPMCVLEAAALAMPILATDVGGTREIIPADCGITVPPHSPQILAEALLGIIRDPRAARGRGARARMRVEAYFAKSIIMDAYEERLRSITRHA